MEEELEEQEEDIQIIISVLLYPLNNIEITNYFSYKPRFNGVFQEIITVSKVSKYEPEKTPSLDTFHAVSLSRIPDGAFVINVDNKNM